MSLINLFVFIHHKIYPRYICNFRIIEENIETDVSVTLTQHVTYKFCVLDQQD